MGARGVAGSAGAGAWPVVCGTVRPAVFGAGLGAGPGAAGAVACTGRITYHLSGPPLAIRNESASAGAPCAVSGVNADNEVQADERGHWIEQRMTLLRPDGQRRPMSVQTRRIEYRP